MDYPTLEPHFQEDSVSSHYPYTHPRTQFVHTPSAPAPLPQQPPSAQQIPHVHYVQPPPSQNRILLAQSPPPQNPHAEPTVQCQPRNPHAKPHANYMQPPPQNPNAKAQVQHAQPWETQIPLPEPEVQFVQPPLNSGAQVIYVQPPPRGSNYNIPALWASSLYSCTDDPCNCCFTLWCPCVRFGQIAEIVDEGSPSCMVSGGIHGLLCLVGIAAAVVIGWPFLTGFGWCYGCSYRTKMRAKYNLAETPCGDCLVHCCCEPCALCQEYKELQHRGFRPALGWKENAGKQKQRAMTPPTNQSMAK